jgi:hypothetical protein
MSGLSASGLANLAGTTMAGAQRLVELGILVARDGPDPFLETDVPKVRLAAACEQAGLPMEGIAAAVRAGRLSFAFLEAALYRRWAVRTGPTYRQVSQRTGVPLELLTSSLEATGFAAMAPEDSISEDELEVVRLLQRGLASGRLDPALFTRIGRPPPPTGAGMGRGPGQPARGRVDPTPGGALCGVGRAAAQGVRSSGAAAGGPAAVAKPSDG